MRKKFEVLGGNGKVASVLLEKLFPLIFRLKKQTNKKQNK